MVQLVFLRRAWYRRRFALCSPSKFLMPFLQSKQTKYHPYGCLVILRCRAVCDEHDLHGPYLEVKATDRPEQIPRHGARAELRHRIHGYAARRGAHLAIVAVSFGISQVRLDHQSTCRIHGRFWLRDVRLDDFLSDRCRCRAEQSHLCDCSPMSSKASALQFSDISSILILASSVYFNCMLASYVTDLIF